jgi:hypothetical protein
MKKIVEENPEIDVEEKLDEKEVEIAQLKTELAKETEKLNNNLDAQKGAEAENRTAVEPIIKISWFQFLLTKVMMYNIPILLIKKVGGRLEYKHDRAKRIKMKFGTEKLSLYKEHVSQPYPPPEAWINGVVYMYSPRKGEYTYLKLDVDAGTIKTLDSDVVFWVQNEIIEAVNKYKAPNTLSNLIPYIGIGVFIILVVIGLIVFMKGFYIPAMEQAKVGLGQQLSCNCSCPIQLPSTPVPPAV